MKKIIYLFTFVCLLFAFSCSDDFLDTKNYFGSDTSSFPVTEDQAYQLVVGMYSHLPYFYIDDQQGPIYTYTMASDEAFGGGSTSNYRPQAYDRMQIGATNMFETHWKGFYLLAFRACLIIESFETNEIEFSKYNKNELLSQAHFIRAYAYHELVQLFENVPLFYSTDEHAIDKEQADPHEVYAFIASDFLKSIELSVGAKWGTFEKGRASKWSAQAYLARTFMFYTGFYGKQTLPTLDGELTKEDVLKQLQDCVKNSGFRLLEDPRNLWPYGNEYTALDYEYVKTNGIKWAGNLCDESLFVLRYNLISGQHNRLPEYYGMRLVGDGKASFPFGLGYSNGPVNSKFVKEWVNDPDYGEKDVRIWGSICDSRVELPNFKGDYAKETERTFLYNKKYMVTNAYPNSRDRLNGTDESGVPSGTPNQWTNMLLDNPRGGSANQYGNRDDIILMRYADVLLMYAELAIGTSYESDAKAGFDQVRQRAGLSTIALTLDNIKKERKAEFFFEGLRYNDLRRWNPTEAGKIIKEAQEGANILYYSYAPLKYKWQDGNDFEKRYKETRGFWPIPISQVELSMNLVQNPGWTDEYEWMFIALPYTNLGNAVSPNPILPIEW